MVDIAIHKPMAYIAFRKLFEKRWMQSTGGAILQDRAKWVTFVV